MKTFQRRGKKAASIPNAPSCTGSQVCATILPPGPAQASTPASSPESQHLDDAPDEEPTPATTESSDSSYSAFRGGWIGYLGLGNRRSSCLVPFQGLEGLQGLGGLLLEQQQASKTKREEQQRAVLQELLLELAAYFSEVDAYELVEESPEPSPDPKAKKKDQNRATGHRQTIGRGGSSQSPPLLQQEPSDACASHLHSLTPHNTSLHSLTPHTAKAVPAAHTLGAGSKAALLSATPCTAAPAPAPVFAGHPPISPVAQVQACRTPGCTGLGTSSKQQLLSTTPSSALHRSRFEGTCGRREVCSDFQPEPGLIHDRPGEGPAPAHAGADDDDLLSLAADSSDHSLCQMLHTGRRSSTFTQLQSPTAGAVQPAPQSRPCSTPHPSTEEPTQTAAAGMGASAQQQAPTSAPFPLAGRRSSVLLPQVVSVETWNGARRSSAQPAPAAAAAATDAAAEKGGEARRATVGRHSSAQPAAAASAAADKGGEARRWTAGRRSSVLVHPQAIQTEGSTRATLPPMPQGTRNTRARSRGVTVPEASGCAAVDGRHGASGRSSDASTTGLDKKEERVTESAAEASDVEIEGGRGRSASEGGGLHVGIYRGSRQRGSRGSSLVEVATCLGDCPGEVDAVPSLGALPEGDEEDGRKAEGEEEEGLERVTQKGWEDGSRDQEEAIAEQGEAKSVSTVARAVGAQQGQGFVRKEGSRDDGQCVNAGQKCRGTSKGAARGGRRGGSRAAAKQRGGEEKSEMTGAAKQRRSDIESEVTDTAKQRRSDIESVVTDAAKQRRSDIKSEVTDAAKQRRSDIKSEVTDAAKQRSDIESEVTDTAKQRSGIKSEATAAAEQMRSEVESEATDTVCGARDQGWGGTAEGEEVEGAPCAQAPLEELTPLQQLLQVCSQSVDTSQIPSMDAFIGAQADLRKISKIGEGTYGEAFKHNKIVFKVVPVDGEQLINGAPQKQAHEMAAEALIALTLTSLRYQDAGGVEQQNVTPSFVETFEVGVCRGPYTPQLVRAWHKWDKAHGSENDPVDSLQPDQLYLVIAMRDCGQDLEKALIASFDQARSLLMQVALTLAIAEEAVEFEHRDLHWGNVLVRPADSVTLDVRLRGVDIEVQTHGVAASIIDFTASRLRTLTGALAYCDLSCDPELFEGTKGVIQFDTYRWMRRLNQDDWSSSCFATNCLWMAYLAEMIVKEKAVAMNAAQKRQLREFRKRASQTLSCGDLICDELFQGLWIAKADAQ